MNPLTSFPRFCYSMFFYTQPFAPLQIVTLWGHAHLAVKSHRGVWGASRGDSGRTVQDAPWHGTVTTNRRACWLSWKFHLQHNRITTANQEADHFAPQRSEMDCSHANHSAQGKQGAATALRQSLSGYSSSSSSVCTPPQHQHHPHCLPAYLAPQLCTVVSSIGFIFCEMSASDWVSQPWQVRGIGIYCKSLVNSIMS